MEVRSHVVLEDGTHRRGFDDSEERLWPGAEG